MTRFLAGDANPIVLTLNEVATGVNTSQMSLPLGNLWLTGGYPIPGFNQGMGVWVHQQAADTTPPRVSYHIPQANRTNYPRHAPLSFLLHEHPRNGGPRNGIDFTVRPVQAGDTLGAAVRGISDPRFLRQSHLHAGCRTGRRHDLSGGFPFRSRATRSASSMRREITSSPIRSASPPAAASMPRPRRFSRA